MKKTLILMLIVGLIAGSMMGVADAKKRKKKKPAAPPAPVQRIAEANYTMPAVGIVGLGYTCNGTDGCMVFNLEDDEAFVSVKVEDDAGTPAGAALAQDVDGDGIGDIFATVCSESSEPIAITPGLPLTIAVGEAVAVAFPEAQNSCPSLVTTGKVTGVFGATPEEATPAS